MVVKDFNLGELKENKEIVIYGAGKIAARLAALIIAEFGAGTIKCFVVSCMKNNPAHIMEIPVIEYRKIKDELTDNIVIVACSKDNQSSILHMLEDGECSEIYTASDMQQVMRGSSNITRRYKAICLNKIYNIARIWGKSEVETLNQINDFLKCETMYIPRLVVVLGTKCSLRCKECNNLMPHYKKQRELETGTILASLRRILDNVEGIFVSELIGGEPFLMSNLKEALSFVLREEKIKTVEITTNGTILPSSEVIELLRNEKVLVRISDYGDKVDKNRLIKYLEDNEIRYSVLELDEWISSGGVLKRHKSMEALREEYSRCSSGYECKTLFEDKLFACARAASLYDLNYMEEEEYLLIDESLSREKIMEFMLSDYSIACDYCDTAIQAPKYVVPGEQME